MPRFLYSVIFLTVVALIGLIFIVWKMSPEIMLSRLLFLGDLIITITLGVSLIFYHLSGTRKKLFVEPRNLYRKQLRRSFFVAIFSVGILSLKFWGGFNKLNTLLLFLFIVALEIFINRRNGGRVVK